MHNDEYESNECIVGALATLLVYFWVYFWYTSGYTFWRLASTATSNNKYTRIANIDKHRKKNMNETNNNKQQQNSHKYEQISTNDNKYNKY